MKLARNLLIVIVSIAIALTLWFIFSNSLTPSAKSLETSEGIYEQVKDPIEAVVGEGKVTHSVFRKMAHFFEFFVLGVEVALLFTLIFGLKLKNIIWILICGITVGIIDESLQNISKRTASVTDVFIDLAGFILAVIISYGIYALFKLVKKKIKRNKERI